jgi:hypothetical protein
MRSKRFPCGLHDFQLILAGGILLLGRSVGHHDIEGRLLQELVGITLSAQISLSAQQYLFQMIELKLLCWGYDPDLIALRGPLKDHQLVGQPRLLSVQVHHTIGVIRIPGLNRCLRDAL